MQACRNTNMPKCRYAEREAYRETETNKCTNATIKRSKNAGGEVQTCRNGDMQKAKHADMQK